MKITRREVLGTLGISAGSIALSSCATDKSVSVSNKGKEHEFPWTYHKLDPDITAERAYYDCPKGHCMYGVFASIMLQLAEEHGEPYRSFPVDMMRYGMGGTGNWGSLCGALNGSAALIGLFTEKEEDIKTRVDQIFLWYEQTELPVFVPKKQSSNIEIPGSISESVLCHVSVTQWCKISGHKTFSKPQKERCKRLTADTARKTVELLNTTFTGQVSKTREFSKTTSQCRSCHTKGSELQNTRGKMSCTSCHSIDLDEHP